MNQNQKNKPDQNKASKSSPIKKTDKSKVNTKDNKEDSNGGDMKSGVSRHPTTELNPAG